MPHGGRTGGPEKVDVGGGLHMSRVIGRAEGRKAHYIPLRLQIRLQRTAPDKRHKTRPVICVDLHAWTDVARPRPLQGPMGPTTGARGVLHGPGGVCVDTHCPQTMAQAWPKAPRHSLGVRVEEKVERDPSLGPIFVCPPPTPKIPENPNPCVHPQVPPAHLLSFSAPPPTHKGGGGTALVSLYGNPHKSMFSVPDVWGGL